MKLKSAIWILFFVPNSSKKKNNPKTENQNLGILLEADSLSFERALSGHCFLGEAFWPKLSGLGINNNGNSYVTAMSLHINIVSGEAVEDRQTLGSDTCVYPRM